MYKSLPNITKADWAFIHVVSCISLVLRKRKYIFHIINFYLNCFVVQKFVFCTMRPTSYTSDVGCVLSTWGPVSNFFHGSCHFGKCKVGTQNLVNLFCSRTSLSRSPKKNKNIIFHLFIHLSVILVSLSFSEIRYWLENWSPNNQLQVTEDWIQQYHYCMNKT